MSVTGQVLRINRTGVSRDPDMAKDMMKGSKDTIDGTTSSQFVDYRREEQLGKPRVATMPAPAHRDKMVSPALLDKLGERLAFERSGVRLYESLLLKHEAMGGFPGGPSIDDLESIRDDELSHFGMLEQVIGRLGGDPTSVTPCANQSAVETRGVAATILDARTTLAEGLHAVLVAELADKAGWEELIELLGTIGEESIADQFTEALSHEEDHLANVRRWLAADLNARVRREKAGSPSTEL